MAIKKFKKQYFLFGSEICRLFNDEGVKAAAKAIKAGDVVYVMFVWDEKSKPAELLCEADGWEDWMQITESQYNKLESL